MATETLSISGLARRLVDDGILTPDRAQSCAEEARKANVPFVTHLVRSGAADAQAIALAEIGRASCRERV